jgi:hypothetical protein
LETVVEVSHHKSTPDHDSHGLGFCSWLTQQKQMLCVVLDLSDGDGGVVRKTQRMSDYNIAKYQKK